MSAETMTSLRGVFAQGIAPVVLANAGRVMDGGTQAGVSQMAGEAFAFGSAGALIGVCPAALIAWPGRPPAPHRYALEPHHTHFVLTPGQRWGDETPYLFALADALTTQAPSLALLVNGGAIAHQEVLENIKQGREIIVVRGSGRLADQIADLCLGRQAPADGEMAVIVREGRITIFDLAEGPTRLARLLQQKLDATPST